MCLGAGISFASPIGAPPSANQGGISRSNTASLIALAHGRACSPRPAREVARIGHIATSAIVLDTAGASPAESLHYTDGAFASRNVRGWGAMLQELVGVGEKCAGFRSGAAIGAPARAEMHRAISGGPVECVRWRCSRSSVGWTRNRRGRAVCDLSSFGKSRGETHGRRRARRVRTVSEMRGVPRSTRRGPIPSRSAS